MKTCPNCGAKMEPDVNFCTVCGSDIRNVAPDSDAVAQSTGTPQADRMQQVQPNQSTQSQVEQAQQNFQNVPNQNVQPQSNNNEKAAVVKQHATNMWAWFLKSLKKPFEIKSAEKWYGWTLLLAENVLLVLGLYITLQNQLGRQGVDGELADRISSFSNSALFQLLLYLLLLIAGTITVTYFVRKWVYGVEEGFFDIVNRITSASAVSAILYVITFIFLLIGSYNTYKYAGFTFGVGLSIIFLACYAVTVGDDKPKNDKFYGLLIVFIASLVIIYILSKIFGQNIFSQFEQIFHIDLSGFFNNYGRY